VKQNRPAARSKRLLIILVATSSLVLSSCARLPKSTQSAAQLDAGQSKTERAAQININTSAADELEKLPGIGKAIGERIVAHRQQYGPFRRAEHLMMVRGISDNKFRQLRNLISVE
jgi:competence ComEA-like helix-hairpin-helix protein